MPRLATDYIIIIQQLDLHKILVLTIIGTEPEVGLVAAIILSLEEMVR